jgi:broad specificity phosphatase PhoE
VYRIEQEVLALVRHGQTEENQAAFPNWTRDEPLQRRYRGSERLEKLKGLKREWDPKGIFTSQLL